MKHLLRRLRHVLASRRCPDCKRWAPRFSTGACSLCGPWPQAVKDMVSSVWRDWEGGV